MNIKRSILRGVVPAAIALIASTVAVRASSAVERCVPEERVASALHHERQPVLETLRLACPLLGRIVEEFALRDLGETIATAAPVSDRAIATIAALAASGDTASAERHARHALQSGATQLELKEALYITAVHAGIPKAIEATRALWDLLAEPEEDNQATTLAAPRRS